MYKPVFHPLYLAKLEPYNPHPLVAAAISYWNSKQKIFAQQVYRQAINLDTRYR
jgi:Flp pilus assembly protein TadD